MRAVILGGAGMLGQALRRAAERRGHEVLAPDKQEADLRDLGSLRRALGDFSPEVVVNAAAYTDVDGSEQRREHAFAVNGHAVGGLVLLARELGARLVQVSTDYVFDGRADAPYREDADPAPLSVYGQSKLLGERLALAQTSALVVRSSWLFGPGGRNFVRTVVGLLAERRSLHIVDDQLGSPTYTPYLANAIYDLAERGASGLVHYTNAPPVTWCGFARAIAAELRCERPVLATTTAALGRPAPRPAFSVLDPRRFSELVGRPVEGWQEGLREYLREGLAGEVDRTAG